MNDLQKQEWRLARLRAAIDKLTLVNGATKANVNEFGRRLGYKDGAFIRQMLSEDRPIREKTIAAIEALPGLRGWFTQFSDGSTPGFAVDEPGDRDADLSRAAKQLVEEIRKLDSLGLRQDVFKAMGALLLAVRDGGGIEDMAGDD